MKNRFYTTSGSVITAIHKLDIIGFVQLPDCTVDNSKAKDKIIIDAESKTFWLLDQKCFENNVTTIKNQFNETLHQVEDFLSLSQSVQKKDTLSVFPTVDRDSFIVQAVYSPGISLRDYFAAQAMQGELSTQTEDYTVTDFDTLSKHAYTIADAMLKARNLKIK